MKNPVGKLLFVLYIAIMFFTLWFEPFGDGLETTFLTIVTIIFLIGWIVRSSSKKLKRQQTIIPEKVGEHSYMDKVTRTIFLRSNDYHTMGGKEWVVSKGTLTINSNDSTTAEVIPLSKIHSMKLEPHGFMSFETLSEIPYMVGDTPMTKIEPTLHAFITFNASDMQLAKTICEYVGRATMR